MTGPMMMNVMQDLYREIPHPLTDIGGNMICCKWGMGGSAVDSVGKRI